MTRIFNSSIIHQPIEKVFDFVTTPGSWPQWHPSSLGVSGVTEHSMLPGEQVTEKFRVAGRKGRAVWTVRERETPRRWVIEGRIVGRNSGGTITYNLMSHPEGTLFEREFIYPIPDWRFALLDKLLIRRRVKKESAEAVRRLKEVLEKKR
jgi:uncharacterized protein YndB with AHSA1/START domain